MQKLILSFLLLLILAKSEPTTEEITQYTTCIQDTCTSVATTSAQALAKLPAADKVSQTQQFAKYSACTAATTLAGVDEVPACKKLVQSQDYSQTKECYETCSEKYLTSDNNPYKALASCYTNCADTSFALANVLTVSIYLLVLLVLAL